MLIMIFIVVFLNMKLLVMIIIGYLIFIQINVMDNFEKYYGWMDVWIVIIDCDVF